MAIDLYIWIKYNSEGSYSANCLPVFKTLQKMTFSQEIFERRLTRRKTRFFAAGRARRKPRWPLPFPRSQITTLYSFAASSPPPVRPQFRPRQSEKPKSKARLPARLLPSEAHAVSVMDCKVALCLQVVSTQDANKKSLGKKQDQKPIPITCGVTPQARRYMQDPM